VANFYPTKPDLEAVLDTLNKLSVSLDRQADEAGDMADDLTDTKARARIETRRTKQHGLVQIAVTRLTEWLTVVTTLYPTGRPLSVESSIQEKIEELQKFLEGKNQ
jgi:hypothetical protein